MQLEIGDQFQMGGSDNPTVYTFAGYYNAGVNGASKFTRGNTLLFSDDKPGNDLKIIPERLVVLHKKLP